MKNPTKNIDNNTAKYIEEYIKIVIEMILTCIGFWNTEPAMRPPFDDDRVD